MPRAFRFATTLAIVVAACFVMHADTTPPSQASEIQLQLGNQFFSEGRYQDALDAYQRALKTAEPGAAARPARAGVIQSALRVAEFGIARTEAESLVKD